MGKKKEFDFEKSYREFMKQAEDNGLSDNMMFQTLMKEFKRIKEICDSLYKGIEEIGAAFVEEVSKGQQVYKTNPCIKDYVSAHKTLVSTSESIKNLLAKVPQNNENDWL